MKKYFLDKRSLLNGYFPVHKEGCAFLQDKNTSRYIGSFDSCYAALNRARMINANSDGCYFCIKNCSKFKSKELKFWETPYNLKIVISEN